ncbi:MAG: ACP S-malonyltransferase [Myxococcales bacterium]|nr:ACP S-malonyltransferase [Myxococcales bacterium]
MTHIVYMFPGQSSRYESMIEKLSALDPACRQVIRQASDVLGFDVAAHYRQSNDQAFARNVDVQLGVFIANHLFLTLLDRAGVEAVASAGLSLGEWNHLVHINALSFEDALLAVQARGRAYDDGPRGQMASIFPLPLDVLSETLADLEGVEIVNLNSPRQNVISGTQQAVERALELVLDEHYVEGVVIERDVPMHSTLFEPVAERFAATLRELPFRRPQLPYMPNRTAKPIAAPTRDQYVELLSSHVARPVLWRETIDNFVEELGRDNVALVEVGPRAVLTNLLDRKWHKGIKKHSCDSREETAAHLEGLVETLAGYREALPLREAV